MKRCIAFVALALAIVGVAFGAGRSIANPPDDMIVAWFGGGGAGEPMVKGGLWDFDNLSQARRDLPASCQSTVFRSPGDLLTWHGWQPDPQSNVQPRVEAMSPNWIDPQSWPGSEAIEDVGGGVLAFYHPILQGFAPGQLSLIDSPVIPAQQILPQGYDPLTTRSEFRLKLNSNLNPALAGLRLIVGARAFNNGQWGPWVDTVQPLPLGPAIVTVPIQVNGEALQARVGVQCVAASPVIDLGPAGDQALGWYWTNAMVEAIEKGVPDISQKDQATCQATAYANCLSYWDDHGYEELVDDENETKKDAHDALKGELIDAVHGPNAGARTAGLQKVLGKKGVAEDQPQPEGRAPLEVVRLSNEAATWDTLKAEFAKCHNCILGLQWYDADGNLITDEDGKAHGHCVTVNGLHTDADGNLSLSVANPWDKQVDEPTAENNDYMPLEVGLNEDGTINVGNESLQNDADGIENADFLCVAWIDIVRPVASGQLRKDRPRSNVATRTHRLAALTSYDYTITNDSPSPITFALLDIEVPYENVQAPQGWTWTPLPTEYPGNIGCNWEVGHAGIAWSTGSNPIPPGGSLSGFGFAADEIYPLDPYALVEYLQNDANIGFFGLRPGPAPLDPASLEDAESPNADLFHLYGAPNPTTAAVQFHFRLPSSGPVRLKIFDAGGRLVREVMNSYLVQDGDRVGRHRVTWDGRDAQGASVAAGTYLYRLETLRGSSARRLVVIP